MVVIGSQALKHYIPLGRTLHDWDLYVWPKEYHEIMNNWSKYLVKDTSFSTVFDLGDNVFVEVKLIEDETDFEVAKADSKLIETPFGPAWIPSIQMLYDIKKATSKYIDEWKHQYDVQLIEKNFPELEKITAFYLKRKVETEDRVSKSKQKKFEFFHKYHIPEYIEHDFLHEMIAELSDIGLPTYKRITVADTDISEELFNKLTHSQKLYLMAEESLVIGLERWFIPQMIENGINYNLIKMWNSNNEGFPTYRLLKHVCITGLKGEADYITKFSRDNFNLIEELWIEMKQKIEDKGGFPKHFYNKLFTLRDKYKAGDKIGLHNER